MKIFNPSVLWLMFLIFPLLIVSYLIFTRYWHNFILIGGASTKRRLFKRRFLLDHSCLYIAFILSIFAYADLYYGKHLVRYENSGLDLVLVMDISNSMLATDSEPSRLDQAKNFALEAVYSLSNSHIGGVAFKGLAIPAIPLTTDSSSLISFLRSAHPTQLTAAGSNLASGIDTAASLFSYDLSRKKVILLFSDGETLSGNLHQAIQKVKALNASIYSVGIGSSRGILLVDSTGKAILDRGGNQVETRLEESALMEASRLTNGRYIKASPSAFNELLDELKFYSSNDYRIETRDRSLTPFFIFFLLLVLSVRITIRSAKWQELYGLY